MLLFRKNINWVFNGILYCFRMSLFILAKFLGRDMHWEWYQIYIAFECMMSFMGLFLSEVIDSPYLVRIITKEKTSLWCFWLSIEFVLLLMSLFPSEVIDSSYLVRIIIKEKTSLWCFWVSMEFALLLSLWFVWRIVS